MQARVITFKYVLKNKSGEVLGMSEDASPSSYIEGADQVLPQLEFAMSHLKAGDRKDVHIPFRFAYGPRDEQLLTQVPRASLPNDIVVGGFLETPGKHKPIRLFISAISDNTVKLDANHPFAGQDLIYSLEVLSERPAEARETEHGHFFAPDNK